MEMTPPPVDVNRLKNILSGAKAVMNKVESGNFETGHVDPRALTEDGVRELAAEGVSRPQKMSQPTVGYSEDTVRNSKLPEAIKKLMIERPIQQLSSPSHTFTLDDVSDIAEKPLGLPKTPKIAKKISESGNLITLDRDELNEMVSTMVNERLLEFFTKSYNKTITEETVKRTVSMLIKEGKLSKKTL